jgi:hypothetical protein
MPSFERVKEVANTPALFLPEKASCNQGNAVGYKVHSNKRASDQSMKILDVNTRGLCSSRKGVLAQESSWVAAMEYFASRTNLCRGTCNRMNS